MRKTIIIIGLLLLIPQMAYAHAYLIESNPEDAATLTEPPQKVTLVFLGFLEHVFSKVEVYDSEGSKVSGTPELRDEEDGTVITAGLEGLHQGQYTVKWFVLSKDGHKQDGSYTFTLK
jgi:methionine-rich copper-binding protein CopC